MVEPACAIDPFLEKKALSYTLELQILLARSVRMNSRAGVLASRVKNEEATQTGHVNVQQHS